MGRLRSGDVDLIVTVDAKPAPGVEIVSLLHDPLRVVLPAGHRLAPRAGLDLSELAAEIWVDAAAGSEARQLLLWACGRAGFIPRVAFESDEYAAVQNLVAAGVGVALVPGLALEGPPPGVVVRPLAGTPVVRHIMAAVHAPECRAPAAGAMLESLRTVAAARSERS